MLPPWLWMIPCTAEIPSPRPTPLVVKNGSKIPARIWPVKPHPVSETSRTLATGQPVLLTAANDTGSAFINPLPNRVCDGRSSRLSNHIRGNGMLWFDPVCFPVPPAGYFGNSGATVLNGPGLNTWDLGF
jgi:hypothetical protein